MYETIARATSVYKSVAMGDEVAFLSRERDRYLRVVDLPRTVMASCPFDVP